MSETVTAWEENGREWLITKGGLNNYAQSYGMKDMKAIKHRELHEVAKVITKILRKEGIKSAVLRGNHTTDVPKSDDYDAYFAINPDDCGEWLYLNFEMDGGKTSARIREALTKHEIPFTWNGGEASCFQFAVHLKPEVRA